MMPIKKVLATLKAHRGCSRGLATLLGQQGVEVLVGPQQRTG